MLRIKSYLVSLLISLFCLPQIALAAWEQYPGNATDIGINNGDIWIIGSNSMPGGFGIFHLENHDWRQVDGGAVAISVDGLGRPWVVNQQGEIFQRSQNWIKLPGSAHDIGVGNNEVWVVGSISVPGGYPIYHWNGRDWDSVSGGAVRIAVDPAGNPWVVNANAEIFRFDRGQWQRLPGAATDIAIGRDGSVWVIGVLSVAGGYGIYHWNGGDWDQVDGGAVRIAVDGAGNPWVVNNRGFIFKYVPENRHHKKKHNSIGIKFHF